MLDERKRNYVLSRRIVHNTKMARNLKNNKWAPAKRGSFVIFGNTIIKNIFSIGGIIGFILMIPLFITSLKKVRRKMKGLQWKKLQRWAYLFYLLSYVHIVFILLNDKEIDWLRLATYTLIFSSYMILRLMKYKSRSISISHLEFSKSSN